MRPFILAIAATCVATPLLAQNAAPAPAPAAVEEKVPFVRADAEEVLEKLAKELEESFVFPEKGEAYAAMLRANLAAGKYASFTDARAFAEAVTADLQAVNEDRHLRLQPPQKRVADGQQVRRGPPPGFNAISNAGWIADGVAYIRFEAFPGNEPTMAALNQFLDTHKDAKSVIIDARTHRGGGLAEMDVLFPQLFSAPTVLVGMDTRVAVYEEDIEQATLRRVGGPEGVVRQEHHVVPAAQKTGLSNAKIYLLTSERTASAGEHLSLSLKRTGRATLIGETTRGAGHYGGVSELGHGFAAFVPIGRTFDPDTDQGWEGTGVKPHVAVPADQALDEALKLAGVDKSGEAAIASLK